MIEVCRAAVRDTLVVLGYSKFSLKRKKKIYQMLITDLATYL